MLIKKIQLASVYVRNTKLYTYNYAEDFRNVKHLILFIIFAQNIDCEHVISKKTTLPRQLAILNTKQCRKFWRKIDVARKMY